MAILILEIKCLVKLMGMIMSWVCN